MVLRRDCGDVLAITQLERKHEFVIEFHSSVDPSHSWVHRGCRTRDVISAVWTWRNIKMDNGWLVY